MPGQGQTPSILGDEFASATEADWLAAVANSTGGRPLDTARDAGGHPPMLPLYGPHNAGPPIGAGGPRECARLRSHIAEPSAEAANTAIRDEVAGGVREIALNIAAPGSVGCAVETVGDLKSALDGIDTDAVAVHLSRLTRFAEIDPPTLATMAPGFGLDPVGWSVTGAITGSDLDSVLAQAARFARSVLDQHTTATVFTASGVAFHEAGASDAQELACLAACIVADLRACEHEGLRPADAAPMIECEVAAGSDLVATIAKLRGVRVLWARIAEECGFSAPARVAARSSARMMEAEDAGSNTLRTTAAALGAIIGGADAVTILPFSHALGRPDAAARRLARNTFHILAEESHIGRVGNPAAGSWAIETITGELCRSAWDLFRAIEAEGGIAAALRSGAVLDRDRTPSADRLPSERSPIEAGRSP